jgi:apolipoprotein N-acyltransferase
MVRIKEHKWRYALAASCGLLLTGAFPKFGLHWLAWFALVPLLMAIRGQGVKLSFQIGFVAGLVHFLTLVYWVAYTMRTYGYLPWPVCLSVLVLLSAVLALYVALFSAVVASLNLKPAAGILMIPLVWVAAEYLRAILFTGFPWELLGSSQYRNLHIIQISDIFGVYGISALIALVNTVIAFLIPYRIGKTAREKFTGKKFAAAAVGTALLLLTLTWAYGEWRLRTVDRLSKSAPSVLAAVVQGNIDQSVKWHPDFQVATVDKYLRLSNEIIDRQPEIVVWPETALPFYFGHNKPLTERVSGGLQKMRTDFLFGSPSFSRRPREVDYYNSAFLTDANGRVLEKYSKAHLVPFGEYVPLKRWLPFLGKMVAQVGDFTAGKIGETIAWRNHRLGVLICYEAIFPYISRAVVNNGATLLVNITNDAWYGFTAAPYQLFSITVFRAIENRRALVRAANTGISGFIDPAGRILSKTDLFTEDAETMKVPLLTDRTFYTRFGDIFARFGLALALVLVGGKAAASFRRRRRR